MLFIENEGALFRGPARGLPQEVWNAGQRKFVPYKLAGQPKPIDWGTVIEEAEAKQLMGPEPAPAAPAAQAEVQKEPA